MKYSLNILRFKFHYFKLFLKMGNCNPCEGSVKQEEADFSKANQVITPNRPFYNV